MILWRIPTVLLKYIFKINIEGVLLVQKPFQTNMTKHQTMNEFIYQVRFFFYENLWLKCIDSSKTNMFDSYTSNIILNGTHKYFK